MEMLLWKVVSLFILLHNLGSSGKNLLRTGIECNSFILNLLKTSLEKVYCKFDFSLLRSVRMAMKNTARFPDQTGTFRRTKMHDLKWCEIHFRCFTKRLYHGLADSRMWIVRFKRLSCADPKLRSISRQKAFLNAHVVHVPTSMSLTRLNVRDDGIQGVMEPRRANWRGCVWRGEKGVGEGGGESSTERVGGSWCLTGSVVNSKKQKAFSFSNSKTKTQNVLNMMTLVKIWCLKEVFLWRS